MCVHRECDGVAPYKPIAMGLERARENAMAMRERSAFIRLGC